MVPAKSLTALALSLALASGAAMPAKAQIASLTTTNVDHAGQLDVPLNKSQVLTVDRPFAKALVGNQEIADILPMTNRSLYVLGKKVGTTSLTLYDGRNMLIAVVDVAVGPDVVTLKRQLSELIPGEPIGARMSNDAVVLTGTVSNAEAVGRAVQIAKTYAGGEDKVVNMLSVGASQQVMLEVRFSEVNRQAAKELGINHSFINNSGKFVGGIGENGIAGVPVSGSSVSSSSSLTNSSSLSNSVDTTLSTKPSMLGNNGTTTQFNSSNSFGSNSTSSSSSASARGGNGALDLLLPTVGFGALGWVTNLGGLRISSALDALERKGLVKTLAEPTLVALSGETASFLAGGEFPIPVAQSGNGNGNGNNTITVEFKPFGVSLGFTPTVLSDGIINLVVEPEVSSIDPSASVQINGLVIPGLLTRRAKTVVELRDGESFAIAGLLRNDFQDTVRQIPVLGSLPIIGALFRSSGFQKQDTELVMIVTPRLVKPMRADDVALPTDRVGNPHELDLFLMGRTDKAVGINPLNPDAMPPEKRKVAPAPVPAPAPDAPAAAAPAPAPAGKTQSGYEL